MNPLTPREKLTVGVTCVLAVILVVVLANGLMPQKAHLRITDYSHEIILRNGPEVIMTINVTNDGDEYARAFLVEEVHQAGSTFYQTYVITIGPGDTRTCYIGVGVSSYTEEYTAVCDIVPY